MVGWKEAMDMAKGLGQLAKVLNNVRHREQLQDAREALLALREENEELRRELAELRVHRNYQEHLEAREHRGGLWWTESVSGFDPNVPICSPCFHNEKRVYPLLESVSAWHCQHCKCDAMDRHCDAGEGRAIVQQGRAQSLVDYFGVR